MKGVLQYLAFFFTLNFLIWLFVWQSARVSRGYSTFSYWDQLSIAAPLTAATFLVLWVMRKF